MKLAVLNTSVVVLARAHNPSILHPAFLVTQGIVPQDWILAEPPVCTPAIALARYSNEIVFTAEIDKFQVLDNAPSPNSPLPELAAKYVEKLPHVHYTAVGINITGFVECRRPQQWILDRFVRQGCWNDANLYPNTVGLRFAYPAEGAVLNLSCDAGSVHHAKEKPVTEGLLVSGNYHVDLSPERAFEEAREAIRQYRKRIDHFDQITQIVLGLET